MEKLVGAQCTGGWEERTVQASYLPTACLPDPLRRNPTCFGPKADAEGKSGLQDSGCALEEGGN